jgi:ectoine hydroxylase-related dioxygenase (phytanoyl-CoA dioxygenase family)
LIKKSQFHTCHRDYNGDFFNEGQKHPSYTIIIYLEDMKKCLDIIPKSHVQKGSYNFNLTDYTQTVTCKNRDAFLFNANLVHNGSINEYENHMRIQMKISHKDDQKTLYFYNDYNKMLTEENHSPAFFQYAQKHASCQFPFVGEVLKKYDHNDGTNSSKSRSLFYAKLEDVP